MAIAFDAQTNGGGADAVTSRTTSHTTGSLTNGIIIARVGLWKSGGAGDVVTSVTYNGNALTQVATAKHASGERRVYLYYGLAPASGAHDLVANTSESLSINIGCATYSGVNQGAPEVSATSTPTSTGTGTGTLTTLANNAWTVMTCSTESDEPAAGASTTERHSDPGLFGLYDSNAAITPAGSTSLNATASSTNWAIVILSLAPFVESSSTSSPGGGVAYSGGAMIY